MEMSNQEMQAILHKINELTNTVVNQSLLLQSLINLMKSKNTLPLVTDQEIIDEFVKSRDAFIKQQQDEASKILIPKSEIVIAEKKVEIQESK